MARRRSRGSTEIRALFRALPDAAREEMVDVLEGGSRSILANMIRRAPKGKTGKLRRGLKYKVSRAALTARIGLVDTPKSRNRIFYARILDLGRRAQVAKAVRRTASGKISRYTIRVKGFTGLHFITGEYTNLRTVMGEKLRGAWDRILKRAGASNG